jgi:hypothetical protein
MTRPSSIRRTLPFVVLMLAAAIPCFLAGFPMPLALVTGFIFASTIRYINR